MKKKHYRVYKNIDWISLSTDEIIPDWFHGELEELERSPNRNYDMAWSGETGAIKLLNTRDETWGTHWIISGAALGVIRGEGHDDSVIAKTVNSLSGKVTRVDIAATVENSDGSELDLTPNWINELANDGLMVSRLKLDNGVSFPDMDIGTCYIGSRKSRNRILRVYDKGIKLDLEKYRMTRIELETRKNADVVVRALANSEDIGAIIRRYVDFPTVAQWVEVLGAESATMPQLQNGMTKQEKKSKEKADRWHWLMTSVAPALAKALYQDYCDPEHNENLRLFNIHTHNILQELIKESERNEKS